jgi:hypothetical protein
MPKKPHFSHFSTTAKALAWRISEPHISTPENLHAKQKPIFSLRLRAFHNFCKENRNFADFKEVFITEFNWCYFNSASSLKVSLIAEFVKFTKAVFMNQTINQIDFNACH